MNTLRLLSEFHAGSLTLADTWAPDAGARPRSRPSSSSRPRRAAWRTPRGRGWASAATSRRPRRRTLEMADAVAAFHFPDDVWARVIYDLVIAARDPKPSLETLVAALVPIYFGRVGELRHREPQRDHRAGRGARRAPGARVRAAQAVPRRRAGTSRRPRRRVPDGRRMSARTPLPVRILIPVANPMTAEELIRLGAAMLDRRAGELSALGIVEVPEGMPLSEGATRARHARRLLQRVLDYAPDGTTIHPIVRIGRHAAEGIIEASAEQEADLIIFGWGGRAGRRPRRRRPDGLLADDRRGRARIAVRHRGRQAARLEGDPARPRPGPRRPARRARAALRRRDRPPVTTRRSSSSTSSRPASRSRSGRRPSARWPRSSSSTSRASSEAVLREAPNVRNAILREAETADLVVMGASAQPGGADGETYLFGALPEAIAARARATVMVVKTREIDRARRRSTSWPPGPRRWPPPIGRPRRRAPSRSGSSAGSASRTSTTPSSPTCAGW